MGKPMKTLKIYIENDEFVLERINEFNHAFKRVFHTEKGLNEALDLYQHVLDEYVVEDERNNKNKPVREDEMER